MMKIPNSKYQIPDTSQDGITLLISVMIMSGLVLITTTVAFLAIGEIRSSRALLGSEPAFIAAKAGGEEGLWTVKRTAVSNLPDCPTATANSYSSSNSFNNSCKSFEGETLSLQAALPVSILLYNPNDPNGDVSLTNFRYNSLSVSNSGSFAINVDVSRIDGTPVNTFQANPNANVTITLPQASTGSEGRMVVTLEAPLGNTTAFVTTDRGLPTNMNIASTGCSTKFTFGMVNCTAGSGQELYTRKIEVKVNN